MSCVTLQLMSNILTHFLHIKIFIVNKTNTLFRKEFKLNETYSLFPPFVQSLTKNWQVHNISLTKNDSIVLTPREKSKWGSIWSRIPTSSNSWKLVLNYSAYNFGSLSDIADGLALWYLPTSSQLRYEPSHHTYGGPGGPNRNFTGLMIAIDNHKFPSNYSLNRTSDQAAIIVVYNEVPRLYDWIHEGFDIAAGRCLVQNRYRNTSNTFSKLAVEYVDEVLNVYHTNESQELELCVTVRDLKMPSGYLLGISAGNGGIVGAYEVHSFMFYDDKRCDCDSQTGKLYTYLYITCGLLILVASVLFLILSIYLIKRCKEKETQKLEISKSTNVTSQHRQRRRISPTRRVDNGRIHNLRGQRMENIELRPNQPHYLPGPPRMFDRDSANYVDLNENQRDPTYDHLKFPSK